MSRVGKKPIPIPANTEVLQKDGMVTVKGGKGTLKMSLHQAVALTIDSGEARVAALKDDRPSRAYQGLMRSLLANMVQGVNSGFQRVLEINGIGYRAELKGDTILFNLGYSHPINFKLPDGISAAVDRNNMITLSGIDKELLGHTAAAIRKLRPPEPYKGKGIKYAEEVIRKKAGKTGTK